MNWAAVTLVIVVVLGVGHLAKAPVINTPTSCGQIKTTTKKGTVVSVIGRLVSEKSKDSGMVLTLEGSDGYQVIAWVSQDVDVPHLRIGSKLNLTGTVLDAGLIAVTDTGGIQVVKTAFGMSVYATQVRDGQAFLRTGQVMATDIPSGYYPELTLVQDNKSWELQLPQ